MTVNETSKGAARFYAHNFVVKVKCVIVLLGAVDGKVGPLPG